MPRAKPTVLDLFAGAGLFSYAFKREGFGVLYGVERDPVAAKTYERNLNAPVRCADVCALKPEGRCDVLIAGPPCQGFSTLGKREPLDSRNSLSLDVLRWARHVHPLVIVIENVAAFLDAPVWRTLARRLRRCEYEVNAYVLNAVDFGVPQVRRRSFTIASRVGMPHIRAPRQRGLRTVREAWQGLPSKPGGENQHYAPKPSELAESRMRVIPVGGDKRDIMLRAPELAAPSWWSLTCEITDVWGRMFWDRPSNTLRTCLQNPSKGRYIHPEQNRVVSLREAARLQSIHDGWSFVGLPTQVARQIGNSVPPALGRAVARGVRRLLD